MFLILDTKDIETTAVQVKSLCDDPSLKVLSEQAVQSASDEYSSMTPIDLTPDT